MLYHLTNVITTSINATERSNSNPEFLTVITKPLTERIVQVRKLLLFFIENDSLKFHSFLFDEIDRSKGDH